MCKFVAENPATEFIVATEEGLIHRLKKDNPAKTFYRVSPFAACPNMKRNTLEKVLFCLRDLQPVVKVDPAIAARNSSSVAACAASWRVASAWLPSGTTMAGAGRGAAMAASLSGGRAGGGAFSGSAKRSTPASSMASSAPASA